MPSLAITVYYPVDFDLKVPLAAWRGEFERRQAEAGAPAAVPSGGVPVVRQGGREALFLQRVVQRLAEKAGPDAPLDYCFRLGFMMYDALGTAIVELVKLEQRVGGRLSGSESGDAYLALSEPEPMLPAAGRAGTGSFPFGDGDPSRNCRRRRVGASIVGARRGRETEREATGEFDDFRAHGGKCVFDGIRCREDAIRLFLRFPQAGGEREERACLGVQAGFICGQAGAE